MTDLFWKILDKLGSIFGWNRGGDKTDNVDGDPDDGSDMGYFG